MASSDSSATPTAVQQRALVQEIANIIVDSRSAPWSELRYEVSSLIGYQESLLLVKDDAGDVEQDWPPRKLSRLVRELRSIMYRPRVGTWFSAVVTVSRDGGVSAEFNYDEPPPWDTEPVAEAYAQDVRKFPRDESATPQWLRERLAEATAEASREA